MFKPVISALYDDKNSEKMLKGAGQGVRSSKGGETKVSFKKKKKKMIFLPKLSELWEKDHESDAVESTR